MYDDFFELLENLPDEKWHIKVDNKWTIKDTIAHLVGWEKECALQIPIIWQSKQRPWFLEANDDDAFNQKNINEYKDIAPKQLLQEWYKWQNRLQEEIDKIGEDNLRSQPSFFSWLFEDQNSRDETNANHYERHMHQIKTALRR